MIYRSALLCVAAALAMTAASAADKEAGNGKPVDSSARLLQRMDRNGDGKISLEEYRNAMLRRFDARDKNSDGVLEGTEFPREWVAGAAQESAQHKLSRDDFSDELEPVFKRFDGNQDGQLDGAEIAAFAAARKANEEAKP